MFVRCIDNVALENTLKLNGLYEVKNEDDLMYCIILEDGSTKYFVKNRFRVNQEKDMVNHPSHYNTKSMECKDVIKVMSEGLEGNKAYCMGAAIKYLYRFENKGKPIEDLKKAKTYIDMLIEELEGAE